MEPRYSVIVRISVQQHDSSFRAEETTELTGTFVDLERAVAWGVIGRRLVREALEEVVKTAIEKNLREMEAQEAKLAKRDAANDDVSGSDPALVIDRGRPFRFA